MGSDDESFSDGPGEGYMWVLTEKGDGDVRQRRKWNNTLTYRILEDLPSLRGIAKCVNMYK